MKCWLGASIRISPGAEERGSLDPYHLAAKYRHKFVNIHPFFDGNGFTVHQFEENGWADCR